LKEYEKEEIACFPFGNQKNQFATVYFYAGKDFLSEEQKIFIKKEFCEKDPFNEKDPYKYSNIKNDECEKQFLNYIKRQFWISSSCMLSIQR